MFEARLEFSSIKIESETPTHRHTNCLLPRLDVDLRPCVRFALADCPPLPPDVQASLLSSARPMGVGYSARPQGGATAPIVVQACVREPGSGQVLLTGQHPGIGPKVRTALREARAWLAVTEPAVAAALGQEDAAERLRGVMLPGPNQDLHVHLGGGWDGVDTTLVGGAIAVALVSLRLRCWPRADVAVLGAFNMIGRLLPSEKLVPQHIADLHAQGLKALVVTDARRMLNEQVSSRGCDKYMATIPGQRRIDYGVLMAGCPVPYAWIGRRWLRRRWQGRAWSFGPPHPMTYCFCPCCRASSASREGSLVVLTSAKIAYEPGGKVFIIANPWHHHVDRYLRRRCSSLMFMLQK